jgi:CheY-like chemotaxis protein
MLGGLRALVIHHDRDLRNRFVKLLDESRATGTPELSIRDATALALVANRPPPNVVVLDPDSQMDAPEILRQVRADPQSRFSAVVVIAASAPQDCEREGFLPGEVWMTSPVDLPDLLLAVALGLERAAAEVARH